MKLLKTKEVKIGIIFSPIYLNYLLNLYNKNDISKILNFNYENLLITVFLFTFLFLIGNSIKKSMKIDTVSIGIVAYLFSFFIVDNISLFITTQLKLYEIFLITNFLWFIYLLLISKEFKYSISALGTYFALNFFSNKLLKNLIADSNIIGDVYDFHYPHVKNIYENGYFYSINNPVLEGYPQFLNYIQALLNNIIINLDNYIYLTPSTNILYFLTILLFLEIDLNRNVRFFMIATFTIFVFNSAWIKFLFLDSLMVEGLVSYLFATTLNAVHDCVKSESKYNYLIFSLFGLLYLSKQFISLITLLMLLIFLYKKKYRKYLIFGFSGLIIQEISYRTFFYNLDKNYHFKQIDLKDTVLDLLLFRDLNLNNINLIIKNIFVDKPLSFLLFIFFLFFFQKSFKYFPSNFRFSSNALSIFLNLIFIFLLYISVWKNMELESPIRYLLSFLHITFITLFFMTEKIVSRK